MKNIISKWKLWQFVEALLLAAIGITTIICALKGNTKVIGIVTGIMLILDGVMHAAVNIVIKSSEVKFATQAIAVAELAAGIWLCIKPAELADNVVLIAALAIVAAGALLLGDVIYATAKKSQPVKYLVMQYIITVLVIAAGVVALVFYPFPGSKINTEIDTVMFVLILIGGVLIGLAIFEIASTIVLISKNKATEKEEKPSKTKKAKKAKAIDVTATEVVEPKAIEQKPEEESKEEPKEESEENTKEESDGSKETEETSEDKE